MSDDHFQRLEALFHELSARPGSDREAAVEALRATDAELADELEALLLEDERLGDRATAALGPLKGEPDADPEVIGPYRLERRLGEGGMGVVYEASQESPVRRRVAIKVIKWGMDTRAVVGRFQAERQALALMEHPHVARVFDAGATAEGRPYFVMELVLGPPITDYCDEHRLPVAERIRLFQTVCEAVEHAHRRGIIHRDLKPGNVLVVEQDDRAVPKVIDFGIARATDRADAAHTVFTELGQIVGTPEYMAPEQASLEADVDTRADVYSLGVVLYELLVGALPIDPERLRSGGLDQMLRRLREEEPVRPSTRVRTAPAGTAAGRGTDRATLGRALGGELDWIVLKALAKDRDDRYRSPLELRDDLERYLEDRPVLAGPPSLAYRARKLVRRHRWAVAGAVAIAFAIGLGVAGLAIGLLQAREAERQARAEAAESKATRDFLIGLFQVSDPTRDEPADLSARDLLDRGALAIDEELGDQPELRAAILLAIGEISTSLGLYPAAGERLTEALRLWESADGVQEEKLAETLHALGVMHAAASEYAAAEASFARAIEIRDRTGPVEALVDSRSERANALRLLGRLDEGLDEAEGATALLRSLAVGPDPRLAAACNREAALHWGLGDLERAGERWREALALLEAIHGDDHPALAGPLSNLATLEKSQGRPAASEPLARRVLELDRRRYGDRHPYVALDLTLLGETLRSLGRFEEAEPLLRESLDQQRELLGAHGETALTLTELGLVLQDLGRLDESHAILAEALDVRRTVYGESHQEVAMGLVNLASAERLLGRLDEAARLGDRALEVAAEAIPPDHWLHGLVLQGRAETAIESGTPEAVDLARRARDHLADTLGTEHLAVASAGELLARALLTVGRHEEARSVAVDSLAITSGAGPGGDLAGRRLEETLAEIDRRP